MASIFQRRQTWWIKFKAPGDGANVRESLQVQDRAKAELLRQRISLELALTEPRLQAVQVPDRVRQHYSLPSNTEMRADQPVALPNSQSPAVPPVQRVKRVSINQAIRDYVNYIAAENAERHVANKISMLRRFLGSARVQEILKDTGLYRPFKGAESKPFFSGEFLDEITAPLLQKFIEGLPVNRKTKRHYREMFHHFFEVCLKFELYQPTSWHRPNPISALPGYVTRNRHIAFLTSSQIDEQLEMLRDFPELRMGAALMIYAGLRRSEALWLTKDAIADDLSYLSVVNRRDTEEDIESSLKTGERTVTILPALRILLREYLPGLQTKWMIPNPSGKRWSPDGFSSKLKAVNQSKNLSWTSLIFRHTFATQRAAEGWSLHRISREMGNSPAIVDEYYAGYIRPPELTAPAVAPDQFG